MAIAKTVDYLIVGQGLAGSCLAYQLIKQQKKIAVIDRSSENKCTSIAAGLFNPVTGQNLVKTWLAEETFNYLHNFYPEIEHKSGVRFFNSMPLYRPFGTIEEQNEWMARSAMPHYQNILTTVSTQTIYSELKDTLGGIQLKQTGFIDTVKFMGAVRSLIEKTDLFLETEFEYDKLEIEADVVKYKDIEARYVIFCEGSRLVENPWFQISQFRPLKGETLNIKTGFSKQVIVNRGVYMVPAGDGEWKVGSTYNLKDKSREITQAGRLELEEKLNELLTVPFEIMEQFWGVRPTTTDRRPLIGKHPKFDRLVIFNGLGTKGVSLAPYFSDLLVQWLEKGTPLAKEVEVTRFKILS